MFCCTISWIFTIIAAGIALYYLCKKLFAKEIDLKGKAVLITGCDTGFGNLLACRLAKMDAIVFATCLDRNSDGAKSLGKLNNISVIQLDITSQKDVDAALVAVRGKLETKKLWALVNNAGIGMLGDIELATIEDHRRAMEVNHFGTIRMTKAFLPLVRAAKGRVVNVASSAGRVSVDQISPYACSKWAMIAFSDSLRREMKQFGVKVSTIEPMYYRTNIVQVEPILRNMTRQWEGASDEIRCAYGEDHYEKSIHHITMGAKVASDNLDVVIDTIVDAIVSTWPKPSYVPNPVNATIMFLFTHLPYFVGDRISAFIRRSGDRPNK